MHYAWEKCIQNFIVWKRDLLEDMDVNGRAILNQILEESGMRARTEFTCSRIGTAGALLWPRLCTLGFHAGIFLNCWILLHVVSKHWFRYVYVPWIWLLGVCFVVVWCAVRLSSSSYVTPTGHTDVRNCPHNVLWLCLVSEEDEKLPALQMVMAPVSLFCAALWLRGFVHLTQGGCKKIECFL
jgi:hypothetical protein